MAARSGLHHHRTCLIKRSFTTWYTLDELLNSGVNELNQDFYSDLETLRSLAADPRHIRVNVIRNPHAPN